MGHRAVFLIRALKAMTPPSGPLHDALKQAKAARAEAQAVLDEAKAAHKRVDEVIDQARAADRAARKAFAAARHAIAEWSASGADPFGRDSLKQFEADATEADRRAEQAEYIAESARAGLPALEQRVRQAESTLHRCSSAVGDAVDAILLADIEPQLKIVEQAGAAYAAALTPIRALLRASDSQKTLDRIRDVLVRSQPRPLDERELSGTWRYGDPVPDDVLALAEALQARRTELREDPPPRWLQQLRAERGNSDEN
jgi:hypothetical protein